MNLTIHHVCQFLETFAPLHLAETWDNVGLLVGERDSSVSRVMTCLTLTPHTVEEAVRQRAELVVAHHPLPFQSLKRITSETTVGRLLLQLIRGGVAVYSPHTAFDSAADGINQHLATKLGILDPQPLLPIAHDSAGLGSGRHGMLAQTCSLADFISQVKAALALSQVQVVGELEDRIDHVAVACGSAGSFLEPALRAGCDVLVTGETNLHTCYEAEARGIALLLAGHYSTERFHLEYLAEVLQTAFSQLEVWASREERDPAVWR